MLEIITTYPTSLYILIPELFGILGVSALLYYHLEMSKFKPMLVNLGVGVYLSCLIFTLKHIMIVMDSLNIKDSFGILLLTLLTTLVILSIGIATIVKGLNPKTVA